MKRMKKLVAALLCLSILPISVFAYGIGLSETEDSKKKSNNERIYNLLATLGFVDDNFGFQYENGIKRMEFARIALKAGGYTAEDYPVTGVFPDVPTDNEYAPDIEMLYNMGIVSGDGNGFAPDRNITYIEAVVILLKLAGYGNVAELSGGYPNGYIAVAKNEGLSNNVSAMQNASLSGDEVLVLVYNMLNMGSIGFGRTDGVVIDKSKTILATVHSIYTAEGVIDSNSVTALNSSSNLTGKKVSVDTINGSVVMSAGNTDIETKIGYYVTAYYRYNSMHDDAECLFYDALQRNNTVEFDLNMLEKFSAKEISYYIENNNKSVKINLDNPAIIYNDAYYSGPFLNKASFKSMSGKVTAIDNNGDKKYDVIVIEAYNTYIVDNAVSSNEVFYDKIGKGNIQDATTVAEAASFGDNTEISISSDGMDKYEMSFSDGRTAIFDDLMAGTVVSVAKSANSSSVKTVKVILSTERKSGSLTAVCESEPDGGKLIELDGMEKIRVLDIAQIPNIGLGVTVFLDAFGSAAYFETKYVADYQYGVMLKEKYDTKADRVVIDIYTRSGSIEKIYLSKKTNVDGVSYRDHSTLHGVLSALSTLQYRKGNSYTDNYVTLPKGILPVRYKLSEDGEIRVLDTPESGDTNINSLKVIKYDTSAPYHLYSDSILGFQVPVNANTTVLKVNMPDISNRDYWLDSNRYTFSGISSISNGSFCNFLAFKVDAKSQYADFVLLFTNAETTTSDFMCMVKDYSTVVYDEEKDEKFHILKGIKQGREIRVPISKDYESSFMALNLKAGDVIKYATNVYGEIESVDTPIFQYKRDTKKIVFSDISEGISDFSKIVWSSRSIIVMMGEVKSREEGLLQFHYMNIGTYDAARKYDDMKSSPILYANISSSIPVTVFDPSNGVKNAVYSGTYDDIVAMDNSFSKHSKVLLRYRSGTLVEVMVFNNLDKAN